jgi:hypothetical protein
MQLQQSQTSTTNNNNGGGGGGNPYNRVLSSLGTGTKKKVRVALLENAAAS